MKLLAQHGHQRSDKLVRGLQANVIDGAILSARYIKPDNMEEEIRALREVRSKAKIMVDPEFYAIRHVGNPNSQLRYLEDWKYFVAYKRRDLVREETAEAVLKNARRALKKHNISGFIAPNIYISESFDSVDAGVALNFIERTKPVCGDLGVPIYATLAVDSKALFKKNEDFKSFLNDVTALKEPPDGFYLLIGGGPLDERSNLVQSELIDRDVIGGWMLINYTLSQQGLSVVNGCSDILSALMGAVGGDMGATGWWSNLRAFSLGRYVQSEKKGGQQPSIRYLSKLLLNRITVDERSRFLEFLPSVNNRLTSDDAFDSGVPDRSTETVQNWEALSSLIADSIGGSTGENLIRLAKTITAAKEAYAELAGHGFSEGIESMNAYLEALEGGLEVFTKYAEI